MFHPRTLLAAVPYNTFPITLGFLGVGLLFLGLSFNTGDGWVPGDPEVYDALSWAGVRAGPGQLRLVAAGPDAGVAPGLDAARR